MDDILQRTAAHQPLHALDVGLDLAVGLIEGDLTADCVVDCLKHGRKALPEAALAAADIDGLTGGQKLECSTESVFCRIQPALRAAVVPMETISS